MGRTHCLLFFSAPLPVPVEPSPSPAKPAPKPAIVIDTQSDNVDNEELNSVSVPVMASLFNGTIDCFSHFIGFIVARSDYSLSYLVDSSACTRAR